MDKIQIFHESRAHLAKINQIYEETLRTKKMSKLDYEILLDKVKALYENLLEFNTNIKPPHTVNKIENTSSLQPLVKNIISDPEIDALTPYEVKSSSASNIPDTSTKISHPAQSDENKKNSIIANETIAFESTKSEPIEVNPNKTPTSKSIVNTIINDPELNALEDAESITPIESLSEEDLSNNPISASTTIQAVPSFLHAAIDNTKYEINEKFKYNELNESVAKGLQHKSLHKLIGFNERYIFLSELFGGNQSHYEMMINELDNCKDKQTTLNKLYTDWGTPYQWQEDNEGLQYLLKIINLKYT